MLHSPHLYCHQDLPVNCISRILSHTFMKAQKVRSISEILPQPESRSVTMTRGNQLLALSSTPSMSAPHDHPHATPEAPTADSPTRFQHMNQQNQLQGNQPRTYLSRRTA
ncbi:hypothetical protein CDL12_13491 [Handroanthus impetiginosus]|uniref:Uncharacterized protein n=1 Tax=Handroanthus impetiginosus TaxID=429701 RepID=A0A2G9H8P5_9LAMI|nr:hypothetical protein CDL12_13490 [Handroanthus impetiginosus]PIN13886.1 hypothetical protein CDL12_13491 [Handroanthus impetiginosus]